MTENFDPFNDRLARDIRNSLSSALVRQLTHRRGPGVEPVAASWMGKVRKSVHRDYIDRCQRQYCRIAAQVDARGIREPRAQAVILWNAGLFFELHELLETVWHGAHGVERIGLKGLIQAAGAYVHHHRGNSKAAKGLARRARAHLKSGRSALFFVANLDALLDSLNAISDPAPELLHRDPIEMNVRQRDGY